MVELNPQDLKPAFEGLFIAYKEKVERDGERERYPKYEAIVDYPQHLSRDVYDIFGSFPEDGDHPGRPTLLTIISSNTHTRIVATCNWNNDWPEIIGYEGTTAGSWEKDAGWIINSLALRLRFQETPDNPK